LIFLLRPTLEKLDPFFNLMEKASIAFFLRIKAFSHQKKSILSYFELRLFIRILLVLNKLLKILE
jgi:hypothetical protein